MPAPAHARGLSLIRDAETEELIREYAKPILKAAGLGGRGIKIHLVKDRSFNAFVVDGRNMFIHVGALLAAKTPNQIIGVIAHESGHIAGGHLARLRAQLAKARSASLMLQILGLAAIAAGAATGSGGDLGRAGAGVMYGGQTAARRSLLAYQRTEESSADQAAVRYLNATGQSSRGMLETFRHFADQGLVSLRYVDPYAMSHPMPQARITQLRRLARKSPYFDRRDPPELRLRHDLMRAKISGFLDNPQSVFRRYPQSDQSLPARYARAIASYRSDGIRSFLRRIDILIAEKPNNPYFHEVKGQFLLQSGKARQAVGPLAKAVSLAPQADLIRLLYAQALLATGDRALLPKAVTILKKALVKEKYSSVGFRKLAQAYQLQGKFALASLASARAYMNEGKLDLAKRQARRAKKDLRRGSPGWIQADDILKFEPRR